MVPRISWRRPATLAAALSILCLANGCNDSYLTADIAPTQGNTAKGEVRFYSVDGGVRVVDRVIPSIGAPSRSNNAGFSL